MRFWDASAIVPLIVDEGESGTVRSLMGEDAGVIVWWTTEVECASALTRSLHAEQAREEEALRVLASMVATWRVVPAAPQLKTAALRVLRVHPLRAADALQLGAAIIAAQHEPGTLPFVCLDARLRAAAAKEGFSVLPG